MRISDIVWKDRIVEKLGEKHAVSTDEVEEALLSNPVIRRAARGHAPGEDVYAAMSQIESGRRLIVFFIHKKRGVALPISARDMSRSERRYYDKNEKKKA